MIYLPMVPGSGDCDARVHTDRSDSLGGFRRVQRAIGWPIASEDCQAKMVITADGGFRRGAMVPLKKNADEALTMRDANGDCSRRQLNKSSF